MGDVKKKKPRVQEIDGVLWQLDEHGNKIKKVKKKDKSRGASAERLSPKRSKKKRSVKEIDGVLYLTDENGNPIKKVRRKGEQPVRRAQSQMPVKREPPSSRVLRAQSVGAPLRRKPGEYVDGKGRRIVIEEDGTKIVFDKNGKRLRPKKRDGLDGRSKSPRRQHSPPKRNYSNGVPRAPVQLSPDVNKHEVGERISEIDRENLELKMNLMQTKDQIDDLAAKAQKEKAKNVKAIAEAEQLRTAHTQTVEHNRTLSLKVKNLEARLRQMDEKIDAVKSMPMEEESVHAAEDKADHLKSQLTSLRERNLSLLNKLDAQKSRSVVDTKAKEEQIIMLNEKLMKIREENDLLFSGNMDPDTVRAKLLRDKKMLEQRIADAKKEKNGEMKEMQATVDHLSKANADLKKKVGKATLEINDDDDEEIRRAKEMAMAVSRTGIKNAAKAKRASIQINSGNHDSRGDGGFGLQSLSALANKSISGLAL